MVENTIESVDTITAQATAAARDLAAGDDDELVHQSVLKERGWTKHMISTYLHGHRVSDGTEVHGRSPFSYPKSVVTQLEQRHPNVNFPLTCFSVRELIERRGWIGNRIRTLLGEADHDGLTRGTTWYSKERVETAERTLPELSEEVRRPHIEFYERRRRAARAHSRRIARDQREQEQALLEQAWREQERFRATLVDSDSDSDDCPRCGEAYDGMWNGMWCDECGYSAPQ